MLPLIQQTISDIYENTAHFILANTVTELTLVAMFIAAMVTLQHLSTVKENKNFNPDTTPNKYNSNITSLSIMHYMAANKNKGN